MRYLTAGESHGPGLTVIIEGVPAGLSVDVEAINGELAKRQSGYGRGRRMQIESDKIEVRAGVRHGMTTGAPVSFWIENKDHAHWRNVMQAEPVDDEFEIKRRVVRPRPGHADLVGGLKYDHRDLRDVLERSSARETAARVAVGALSKQLLDAVGMSLVSYVKVIGGIESAPKHYAALEELRTVIEASPVRTTDETSGEAMMRLIDEAKAAGDSLGGVVCTEVHGVIPGLGSYVQYDRKLDAAIARAVMSVNAIKGVAFGDGFDMAYRPGSEVMDPIAYDESGYTRLSNHLGGFEGGMTTGMPIVCSAVMKPIPTLYKPLQSVDIDTKQPFLAQIERSDACAVPAASLVVEAVVAFELARELCETFGHDTVKRIQSRVESYREEIRSW
ncbi:chorismate synthase [Exiguobacterium sp. SH3S2]|uniref:chorismate synthase n=1 Tax=unclassified Exiguobacterium TaxID=2644629 RepID=UPI0010392133|nr:MULTISPECIES: chorismate synthase [unclassified Exiguobacterium]TCI37276.1 chorismate synthase [Exiguobacterium sp. SH4S7]TCI45406.1 chorismate synthase [Exiguobacterium sp. SH5S32]TCI49315.1 chorismate synthase [Exiguobacterium sp. SH3S3]TCI52610.1 chorismate synthase [Exiguobacterium sp. SH1S4]TCI64628.1 chorismate synthase [Exiguobacterium sp. SH3S2]